MTAAQLLPGLERKLKAEITGDVMFDRFSRGRYATDASHYQMTPLGVVAPRTAVEAGIVLDDLNRRLKPFGLWFPVDVSTASRETIGGMTANNSCGGRSLRYGTMRDNVLSIDAVLADGTRAHFGPVAAGLSDLPANSPLRPLATDLLNIGLREADEIEARFPKVQRRVGGYNLDSFAPNAPRYNLAHILLGSEGTLAFSTRIELKLSPLLGKRAVGACHFGSFYEAMNAAQHLVKLKPIAVELVDRTMLELAGEIAMFRPTLKAFVSGEPEAILLVEFDNGEAENRRKLKELAAMMGDLGFGFDKVGAKWGGIVEVLDPALQTAIADVRTSGLNIMMSMKEQGKPVSFVEDCAVSLEHLAEYTTRLTEVFERNGTRGTWYAHASVGCLHVRPVLNLRLEKDVKAMRAIAQEAFTLVRDYKGSHSGEHGDGIVRSEFHAFMFGKRLVTAFEEVKDKFDPNGVLNPGKIVRAPKFDDREKFRYGPSYAAPEIKTQLDWSAYTGSGGGFQGAVEMCNNNGACRKSTGGVMCPSYRVTRDERDVTRGRANSLRLAITRQLGGDALTSDEMAETMKLCVSCKGCRHECPTGVDMARMKIEVQAARAAKYGLSLRDRLIGWMPRYAPYAARFPWLFNARDKYPKLKNMTERVAGLSARRTLPQWRKDIFADLATALPGPPGNPLPRAPDKIEVGGKVRARANDNEPREVVLLADTFNRYFERENLDAAVTVLRAAGYIVHTPKPVDGSSRPLCCGRTFLSVGRVDQARHEAERVVAALAPYVARGVPVVGLEPSCILGFRDEVPAMLKTNGAAQLSLHALMFEEFLVREAASGRLKLPLGPIAKRALVHGHCHQKAFGMFGAVATILRLVPGLKVEPIESSCCGMAGAFGYAADTIDVSMAMGELSLLPAVRKADPDTLIVADGTSCRHQIHDGGQRDALHVARVLAMSLAARARSGAERRTT